MQVRISGGKDMADGGAAAVAAAAIADAIKASGVLVRVEPEEFAKLLGRTKEPLIVTAEGFFRKKYQYLTSYKGLAFFTKSSTPLALPGGAEVVRAGRISIPG
jgi:hypothetical protein